MWEFKFILFLPADSPFENRCLRLEGWMLPLFVELVDLVLLTTRLYYIILLLKVRPVFCVSVAHLVFII